MVHATKPKTHGVHECPEMDRFNGAVPLDELARILPSLQRKYGKRAVLVLDAGPNNVSVNVEPTKKPTTPLVGGVTWRG